MKTQNMDLGNEYHLACDESLLAHLLVQICMKNKLIYEQELWEVRQETVGWDWSSIYAVVTFIKSMIKSGMAIQLLL